MKSLAIALRATLVTLVLTGLLYPAVVTALAQVAFPHEANGSLVEDAEGKVIGSHLIGQKFTSPAYLQGRPSAVDYDASTSGGSNFGTTSAKLKERAEGTLASLQRDNPVAGPVPAELLTASGSGLDPHLSPDAALWQIPRIAAARKMAPERIRALIESMVEGRDLGFLGEPVVNVLEVNLALDRQFGAPVP